MPLQVEISSFSLNVEIDDKEYRIGLVEVSFYDKNGRPRTKTIFDIFPVTRDPDATDFWDRIVVGDDSCGKVSLNDIGVRVVGDMDLETNRVEFVT